MKLPCYFPYHLIVFDVPGNKVSWCCKQTGGTSLSEFNPTEYYNNALLTEMRTALTQGVKHPACQLCWRAEADGITSWRQLDGKLPQHLSTVDINSSPHNKMVSRLEIKIDNTCDLACIYCGPWDSTAWQRENKKTNFYDYPIDAVDNGLHQKILDTITEIVKHSDTLEIGFSGGESLISKHIKNGQFKKFVDAFYAGASPNKNLTLKFVTNCNTLDKVFDKNLQTLRDCKTQYPGLEIHIAMSLESTGEYTQVTRYLSDWDQVNKNINKWLACDWIKVSVNTAFNAISIVDLSAFITYLTATHRAHNRLINISPNVVYWPDGLSPSVLPESFKIYVQHALELLHTVQHIFVDDPDCGYMRFRETLENIHDTIGTNTASKHKLRRFLDYMLGARNITSTHLHPMLYDFVYN